MQRYIANRLLLAIPTVLGATLMVFFIMRVAPGDVVDVILGEGQVTEEQKEKIRDQLGLNDPLPVQYLDWLGGLVTLDPGTSLLTGRSIVDDVKRRIPVTLELAVGAIGLSLLIAVPIGVISAVKQDTIVDYIFRVISVGGLSLPSFWLATLALLVLNRQFGWLPPIEYRSPLEDPGQNLKHMILPVLILGYALSAVVARMTRSSMLEVLREDYIRTARAKGLRGWAVIARHALKNAMLPVITISSAQLGYLIGGSVIMESIFVIPGMGQWVLDGITNRDYPVLQFAIVFIALVQVLTNLITDLLYGALDPRIRYGR
jgi:peptide/nickel transport system permease protein